MSNETNKKSLNLEQINFVNISNTTDLLKQDYQNLLKDNMISSNISFERFSKNALLDALFSISKLNKMNSVEAFSIGFMYLSYMSNFFDLNDILSFLDSRSHRYCATARDITTASDELIVAAIQGKLRVSLLLEFLFKVK